jgi:Flp pilus assembly protein TadG
MVGKRAQALVEFALVMPIMLFVLLGLIDFGRAYVAGVALEGASREGARLAIDRNQTDLAVLSRVQLSAQPIALASADITVCVVAITPPAFPPSCLPTGVLAVRDSSTTGKAVTVTTHTFVPFFTAFLTNKLGFSGVPVTGSTSMQGL